MKSHVVSFLLPSAGVLALVLALFAPRASAQLPAGTLAPAWEVRDLAGNPVKSDQFNGKVVILDFWTTWCPPCRKEIPGFVDLYRKYGDKGLVVVGVSLDQAGPSVVKSFAEKVGMKYPVVVGDQRVVEAFGGVQAIPTTFVIDRAGKIVGSHVGYDDRETFEKEIKPLL